MKNIVAGLVLAGIALLTATTGPSAKAADVFALTSSAFQDNGTLDVKNGGDRKDSPNCLGQNVSPPFAWSNPPDGTKSFALLMTDLQGLPPLGVSHMVIYGIPAAVTGFAEGELSRPSEKFVGGKSTMSMAVYAGPCTPPDTDWHHYTFVLIATDLDPKALPPGLTREELAPAIKGHVRGTAGLIGRFKHP